jgi:hypothetical protein
MKTKTNQAVPSGEKKPFESAINNRVISLLFIPN